ncbi:putative transcription factor WD40-like family [Helianthus annuus]|uniref:Transcription factor WD40-like family n=1 Tax=Helianthus annuus TaxID=4232 RepID=A0A9K3J2F4_HELAN|nr:putative transcription factor WD40-like family [Helianthus annuus]KAJ0924297.1 putative transcription factor WD40-like family [Helianthus annuus]
MKVTSLSSPPSSSIPLFFYVGFPNHFSFNIHTYIYSVSICFQITSAAHHNYIHISHADTLIPFMQTLINAFILQFHQDYVKLPGAGSDSDVDEYDYMSNKLQDTSAAQARRGKDIQGIQWERLSITREKYRQTRLEQYKNYENIPHSGEGSEKACKVTNKTGLFYDFRQNSRSARSTILHFQLRNLVWATSKHDVYLMSHFSVFHWSSLKSVKTEVLNVSGHVAPCEKHPGSLLEGFTQTQVSTMAIKDNLLVAGGFQGELICKYLDRPGVCYCSRTTYDENAITNALDIYTTPSGAMHFTASNNDCGVREFDMENFQMTKHFRFPWPVNHTSISPDGKLLIVVGDNPVGLLVDSRSGKTVASLFGHLDFSFASAWHPDGQTFATGNQDKTCRVWDIRNLSKSVTALKGNIGAIRSIRYSSDGRFMAMAEPADFVHVFDVNSGYEKEQEIDFFGEISGTSFSPDTESLFIGVWDRTYGSLLELGRRRKHFYLDSLI